MFTDKAPYLVTLFVAAVAWAVTHFVDRVIDAPTLEFTISTTPVPGGALYSEYVVKVRNLSGKATFREPEFTIVARDKETQFVTKGDFTTIRARPPGTAVDGVARVDRTGAYFKIPVFPPQAEFDLITRYGGTVPPVFVGRPPAVGTESFVLLEASLQTWLAKHEFSIITCVLGLWLLLLLILPGRLRQ